MAEAEQRAFTRPVPVSIQQAETEIPALPYALFAPYPPFPGRSGSALIATYCSLFQPLPSSASSVRPCDRSGVGARQVTSFSSSVHHHPCVLPPLPAACPPQSRTTYCTDRDGDRRKRPTCLFSPAPQPSTTRATAIPAADRTSEWEVKREGLSTRATTSPTNRLASPSSGRRQCLQTAPPLHTSCCRPPLVHLPAGLLEPPRPLCRIALCRAWRVCRLFGRRTP